VHRADRIVRQNRIAFDVLATWQAKVLADVSGKTAAVTLSILAHNYDEALLPLLELVFPGFVSITAPFLSTASRVNKSGHVVADMVMRDGQIVKDKVLYRDEMELRDDFRRLADRLQLNDSDRIELFTCVKNWVVADRRLDPAFDPLDPDAKRLH